MKQSLLNSVTLVRLASVAAVFVAIPAQAGFDWVPPVVAEKVVPAPTPDVMAPVSSELPVTVAPISVTPVIDIPKPSQTITPSVAAPAPVSELPRATAVPKVVQQDRTKAVYPPPGNAAAAPLAVTGGPNFVVPTDGRASAPVAITPPVMKEPVEAPVVVAPKSDVTWNDNTAPSLPPADTAAMAMEKAEKGIAVEPLSPAAAPADMASASAPITSSKVTYAVIDGFGDQLPLQLALDQVVPRDYKVVYEARPEPGMMVSWSGGRPWNDVVSDMLYTKGLRALISDKTVTVVKVVMPDAVAPATVPVVTKKAAPVVKDAVSKTVISSGFDANKVEIFSARPGDDVQAVLGKWSDQAKVQLYWQANRHYTLKQAVGFNTTYTKAVQMLLDTFGSDTDRPVATLHPNLPEGPAVLTVSPVR
jgi:hypothetical protein